MALDNLCVPERQPNMMDFQVKCLYIGKEEEEEEEEEEEKKGEKDDVYMI